MVGHLNSNQPASLGMDSLYDMTRPRHLKCGMIMLATLLVVFACMCTSVNAVPVKEYLEKNPPVFLRQLTNSRPEKRGPQDLADAWALCPPDMEQADCFYRYLRLYARLRKAARETDRVSMRNIGKRSHVQGYMCSDTMDKLTCFTNILKHNLLEPLRS